MIKTILRDSLFCCMTLIVMMASCNGYTPKNPNPGSDTQLTASYPIVSNLEETATPVIDHTQPAASPTLSKEDAKQLLAHLLENNNNCNLPCVWGITPNQTTVEMATDNVGPLGVISNLTDMDSLSYTINPSFTINNLTIFARLLYIFDESKVINHISLHLTAQNNTPEKEFNYDSSTFGEIVKFYELPNILNIHGEPDAVYIGTLAGDYPNGGNWGFHILLIYPDQGILIDYITNPKILEGKILGCPKNALINMELYPPGNIINFNEKINQSNWKQNIASNYKPIEQVTNLSIKEFYENFRLSAESCIETPINYWPTPMKN